eukprot:CAMPEP_0113565890 /NCGR_PEP_ID=MMETSP0015_2-20120614/22424_1 /TAXON_ID=2838 /ORGANISM="Odontella" /LENGTH=122 /DNA_ID=CAMNT_0000468129 /DNA_START=407 /DNA_END=775 /DNA_ORIENTATION=- /assembly_acc=CAM_ASM_000160
MSDAACHLSFIQSVPGGSWFRTEGEPRLPRTSEVMTTEGERDKRIGGEVVRPRPWLITGAISTSLEAPPLTRTEVSTNARREPPSVLSAAVLKSGDANNDIIPSIHSARTRTAATMATTMTG